MVDLGRTSFCTLRLDRVGAGDGDTEVVLNHVFCEWSAVGEGRRALAGDLAMHSELRVV
jgi:hypothetical protein